MAEEHLKNNYRKDMGVMSFLIFLVSPILAVLVAAKNFRSSWAKNVLWAFVAFYGYTFVILNEGMDSYIYKERFLDMASQEMTFSNFTRFLYGDDSQILDILQPLVSFLISRFTENYHVLFAVFGLIFGYFYSRNIWYVLERTGPKLQKRNIFIVITLAVVVGFWEINGFRFWTASHIFFFGVLPYLWENKKKYLWISFLSVFVHFSFLLPVGIVLIYLLFGNKPKIYFYLFLASSFIVEINLESVGRFLQSVSPDLFQDKVQDYTNTVYAEAAQSKNIGKSLHAILYSRALKYVIFFYLIVIYFRFKKYNIYLKKPFLNLFNFTLLFFTIANIISQLPSGGRFIRLGSLFAVAVIFFYNQFYPYDRKIKSTIPFWGTALILFIIVSIRIGTETIGYVTIIGNPITMLFVESETALIEFIKK